MNTRQSHHKGLKLKSTAKACSAPATPPMADVCVDIFHQMFITTQHICMARAAMRMMLMKWGMCVISMSV